MLELWCSLLGAFAGQPHINHTICFVKPPCSRMEIFGPHGASDGSCRSLALLAFSLWVAAACCDIGFGRESQCGSDGLGLLWKRKRKHTTTESSTGVAFSFGSTQSQPQTPQTEADEVRSKACLKDLIHEPIPKSSDAVLGGLDGFAELP